MKKSNKSQYRVYITKERYITTDHISIGNGVVDFIPKEVWDLRLKTTYTKEYVFPKWKLLSFTDQTFSQEWVKSYEYNDGYVVIYPLTNIRRIENVTM